MAKTGFWLQGAKGKLAGSINELWRQGGFYHTAQLHGEA